jgi:hypothetical protein
VLHEAPRPAVSSACASSRLRETPG